ncbi:MAG TPA: hypothetical protein VJP02_00470 [Candidatus Sulfotelmatobacter sp.]|nr:hypothetical protein [Candidatus Sulfotelmatobacter sp.]
MEAFAAAFYLIAIIFGIVLVIAWIVFPLAIIGTKPLLRQLIAEAQKTNALLQQRINAEPAPAPTTESQAVADTEVRTISSQARPESSMGNCPNCESVIPLSASECPKCGARFGPGSAWAVSPFKKNV